MKWHEKFLWHGVKLAAVGITAPATVAVIQGVFPQIGTAWGVMVIGCGVFLIEGVFIGNWLQLEQHKGDSPEQKARYVIGVWVMYVALVFIGLAHGEGIAALPLRVALGLALAGATWDTIVYGWEKAIKSAERNIQSHRKVKRYRRRAEIEVAKLEIDLWKATQTDVLQKESERDSRERKQKHVLAVHKIERESSSTERMVALKNGNPQYPPAQARADRKMKRIERLRFIPQALRADPELQEMPTTALVERLREQTGAGESTIYGDLSELKERGIIEQNGKVKVLG